MSSARDFVRRNFAVSLAKYTPYGLYALLRKQLADCESVLDLGCGEGSIIQFFSAQRTVVGVDRYEPSLRQAVAGRRYTGVVLADIAAIPFLPGSFDAVTCFDLIEHFSEEEGCRLLPLIESLASKKVIVYTPNGFVPQGADVNPWQLHRSGWEVDDFLARGYRVYGIHGWKALRGEYAKLRFRPWLFWEMISFLSQCWIRLGPAESAFAVCAIKELEASLGVEP